MAWLWWLRAAHLFLFTGEGQYGKVYTCINVDTGELMAMKEVGAPALWGRFCLRPPCGRDLEAKLVYEVRASLSASIVSRLGLRSAS